MAQKLKPRKALRVPLLKIQNAGVNQLAMLSNFELTSSSILSLLSLNSYTSIAGAITPRMLSKQKNSTHNSRQDYFLLKSCRQKLDDRIARMEDFFKYTEMSIAPHGKRYFIQSLPFSILLRELMGISSATLSFSLPLFLGKNMVYSSLFPWLNNVY